MEETLKNILKEMKSLNNRVTGIEEGQHDINSKVTSLQSEVKSGFESINKRLDSISVQVAHNTEQEARLDNVSAVVKEHSADIKLLKKIVSNQ